VERPRSVVSNIEHGTAIHPHRTLRPYAVQGNTSSSTLNQQQMLQQHGCVTPSLSQQMHHSLAISASGSCLMDTSFHSALDANGVVNGSQQQLERGEIVMEHILGNNEDSASTGGGRRRLLGPGRYTSNHQQHGTLPLRVPVPPPVQSFYNNQSDAHSCVACSSSSLSNNDNCPPLPPPRDQKRLNTHAYVNVDLKGTKGQPLNLNVREFQQQKQIGATNSTDRRLEFLSSGPGAFQLQSSSSPKQVCEVGGRNLSSSGGSVHSCSAFSPTSSPMQHSFHSFCPINNEGLQKQQLSPYSLSPYRQHQNNNWNRQDIKDSSQRLMSQSISGALPPSPSGIFSYNGSNNCAKKI
jgi:hypothetical protein